VQVIFFVLKRVNVIILFVLAAGCENPFTTREPEPPEQNSSNFIPPTTPEIVFANLKIAIQERNVENYIRSFVDTSRSSKSFTLIPDQGVAATNPGIFQNWRLEDERRYITQLLQVTPSDSIRNLRFIEESRSETASTASFTQSYELILRHTRQTSNIPTEFRGQSRFMLEKDQSGDWAIYRWEDFATNDADPSWSELKAFFQ
jgi:hypothetical protein